MTVEAVFYAASKGTESVWYHEGKGHETVWHHEVEGMRLYGTMGGGGCGKVYGIMTGSPNEGGNHHEGEAHKSVWHHGERGVCHHDRRPMRVYDTMGGA